MATFRAIGATGVALVGLRRDRYPQTEFGWALVSSRIKHAISRRRRRRDCRSFSFALAQTLSSATCHRTGCRMAGLCARRCNSTSIS
jgi:hypothetical protein